MQSVLVHAVVSQTAIYDSSIIWTQTVPPRHGNAAPESLYWSGVQHIVRHHVFTFPSGTTVLQLEISRDWIVAELSGSAGSSIWAFNRRSHHAHTVTLRAISGGSTLQGFVLWQDSVAYIVDTPAAKGTSVYAAIHVTQLPGGPSQVALIRRLKCGTLMIASAPSPLVIGSMPSDCAGGNDVFQLDPSTGQVTFLTQNHSAVDVSSNGSDALWLQYRRGQGAAGSSPKGRIVLDNLSTGRTSVVSHAGSGWPTGCATRSIYPPEDQCAELPGLTDNLAYWIDGLGDPTVRNLATGRNTVIQTPNPPGITGYGQGWGHSLSWASQVLPTPPYRPRTWIVVATVG
jgi:hypothetical protein